NAPKAALESAARTIGARTSHPNPLHSVYAKAGTGSFFDDTDSEDEDDDNICRSDNEQGGIFTPPAGTSPRTGSSSSVDSVGSGLNLS
ncbi:MAG: hypothetical protein K0Q74_1320, partial [Gammaproteobacteria bacterium]|nr:hypothetical protein [Gammaproteobacteria bacterium]